MATIINSKSLLHKKGLQTTSIQMQQPVESKHFQQCDNVLMIIDRRMENVMIAGNEKDMPGSIELKEIIFLTEAEEGLKNNISLEEEQKIRNNAFAVIERHFSYRKASKNGVFEKTIKREKLVIKTEKSAKGAMTPDTNLSMCPMKASSLDSTTKSKNVEEADLILGDTNKKNVPKELVNKLPYAPNLEEEHFQLDKKMATAIKSL